jgi:predicted CopG family antitoxin
MSTTIQVTQELAAKLKKLKVDTEAKSIDAVITALLNERQPQNDADVAENSDQEEGPVPPKRRKFYVEEALYSLEVLSERRGMLEYYTGFDRSAVDLLIRVFSEVRTNIFFFGAHCPSGRGSTTEPYSRFLACPYEGY